MTFSSLGGGTVLAVNAVTKCRAIDRGLGRVALLGAGGKYLYRPPGPAGGPPGWVVHRMARAALIL